MGSAMPNLRRSASFVNENGKGYAKPIDPVLKTHQFVPNAFINQLKMRLGEAVEANPITQTNKEAVGVTSISRSV